MLVVGLDPERVPGPWDPQPVLDAIAQGMAGLAAHGYDAASCLVGVDGSEDVEATVTTALRSATWDCVLVGGGLRGDPDLVELLEAVVDLVRRYAGDAPLAFNSTPSDLATPVARALARRARA